MTRTLEEILAYSRETGMDWALDAEEAGLLRLEVERLRARHYEASANPSEDPTEANQMSHCNTGKCGGKSGACDCNCRGCFSNYAYDLWRRDIEVRRLQALVDAATPIVEVQDDQFVHVNGQFIVQEKPVYARGIAGRLRIALARDLAAKEKEPTR